MSQRCQGMPHNAHLRLQVFRVGIPRPGVADSGHTPSIISSTPMHARRRSTPEQRRRWDLSNLQFIMSGAEPIKAHTMTTFFTTFAECGLKPSVFCSAYGLAEHVCGEPFPLQRCPAGF